MSYDVKDWENSVCEDLFPFYSDFFIKKIGYKLKKHWVQTKQGNNCRFIFKTVKQK